MYKHYDYYSMRSLELSGEQCPGILTLTCDTMNFGVGDSINWFVGDERLAVFDANVDSTPFTITTSPDLLNATVHLTSVLLVNGQFSFINFTLCQCENVSLSSRTNYYMWKFNIKKLIFRN